MKKCPYCAEEIQDEAVKCRFCGKYLKGSLHAQKVLIAGAGILAFVGIVSLIVFVVAPGINKQSVDERHDSYRTSSPSKPRYSSDEFKQLVMNNTVEDVVRKLGRPDDVYENSMLKILKYRLPTYEPLTGKIHVSVDVWTEGGSVRAVSFKDY